MLSHVVCVLLGLLMCSHVHAVIHIQKALYVKISHMKMKH